MHLFRKLLLIGLVGLGLACGTRSASANTVNASVAPASISQITDWVTTPFVVDQFDPSLGTLLQVDFTLKGELDGSVTLKNKNLNSPASYNFSLEVDLASHLPTGDVLLVITSGAQSGILGPGASVTLGSITGSGSASKTVTTNLAAFIGLGTFNVPTDAAGLVNNSSSSNINLDANSTATASP
jgi:hypothetical protein